MEEHEKEFLNLKMSVEDYSDLPPELRHVMEIKTIDVEGFDYSFDELWQKLKKESDKAFKQRKKREFELRHNMKK